MIYKKAENEKHVLEIAVDECPESPRDWDNLGTMACTHRRYSLGDEQIDDRYDWLAGVLTDLYGADDKEAMQVMEELEEGLEEAEEKAWELFHEKAVVLPLYLYDHSGITISTTSGQFRMQDSAAWDWGQIGWIYVSHEKIFENTGAIGVFNTLHPNSSEFTAEGKNEVPKELKPVLKKIEKAYEDREWTAELAEATVKYLRGEVEVYDQYLRGDIYGFCVYKKCKCCGQKDELIDSCSGFFGDDFEENGIKDALLDYLSEDVVEEFMKQIE